MKKIKKFLLWSCALIAVLASAGGALMWYCNYVIISCNKHCFSDINKVPETETALLLGAAKITPNGVPNLYFAGRIEAAVQLFKTGKIKHILISGDNSRIDYDEPTDMKNALIEQGIPEEALLLDFAGFRTLDSVVRAKNVFGKNKFLVITQNGHAERAVYIARKQGIEATAFYAAEPIQLKWLVARNRKREKIARFSAWLDVNILRCKPKFER